MDAIVFTLARQGAALELSSCYDERLSLPADFLPDDQAAQQQQRPGSAPEAAFAGRVAGTPSATGGGALALPKASAPPAVFLSWRVPLLHPAPLTSTSPPHRPLARPSEPSTSASRLLRWSARPTVARGRWPR